MHYGAEMNISAPFVTILYMKKYLIQAAIFLIVSLTSLICQEKKIYGKVIDKDTSQPLLGANIILIGENEKANGASTDESGNYSINILQSGIYTLKATYIGYDELTEEISIMPSDVDKKLDIELSISSIQLQEYIVTASRGRREKITDAPAAISIISARKIRAASNPNLGDYFKNIKGVDFTASGLDSYNLSARGFNSSFSSRLLTLTDGRMANVPSLRLIAYNVIPVTSDDVEQIEVVLGPSSALYGPNAHSGVINIITKKPSEYEGANLSYTVGTRDFRKWQVRHSGKNGKIGYKLSFVDFSAYDWKWIDEEEKKGHMSPWIEDKGALGDQLDDGDLGEWIWDGYNIIIDKNNDGKFSYNGTDSIIYAIKDGLVDNITSDINNDGLSDTVDFHIENQRVDFRFDYDFSKEHFISLNHGQAVARNINITGIGRYLADNWIYRYYQYRHVYNNWFAQVYLNTSNAGNTRSLRTGDKIFDESTFLHIQMQHSLDFDNLLNSTLIWGIDYQRTMPKTFGTILPDGTGGKSYYYTTNAPQYPPESHGSDSIDNDGDGEIDEWDELFITNEYGLYGQFQSKFHTNFEFIGATRLDLHSNLINNNGINFLSDPLSGETIKYSPQWSPKIGLLWKPYDNQTFRLTAAKAFNTPSSQALFLDVRVATVPPWGVYARGNAGGYHYSRDANGELLMYDVRAGSPTEFNFSIIPESDSIILLIPPVLGRPHVFVEQEDYTEIKPIVSEIIWTYELGYSGFIGKRARVTFDLYYSEYSDFVSDLTWITPIVMDTSNGFDNYEILGIIASSEHDNIDIGADNISGTDDDSKILDPLHDDRIELSLTNINYGQVFIHGFDMSIYAFLTKRITTELNASYLGMQEFYNPLTRDYDPINAPQYKINSSVSYESSAGLTAGLNIRYIPRFKWSAGVFYGTINQYFIADANLGYKINNTYSILANITNLFNDVHREIVGGPELGRHFTFKVSATL